MFNTTLARKYKVECGLPFVLEVCGGSHGMLGSAAPCPLWPERSKHGDH